MDSATLQIVLTAEGVIVSAAIGYAAERYRRWTGSQISVNDQRLLTEAATNGLARGQAKLAAGEPVGSIMSDAVSYVRTMRPQLVAKGDKDKTTPADWLERFVEAVAAKPDAPAVIGPTHSDFVAAAMEAAKTGSFTIPAGVTLDQPVTVAPAPVAAPTAPPVVQPPPVVIPALVAATAAIAGATA